MSLPVRQHSTAHVRRIGAKPVTPRRALVGLVVAVATIVGPALRVTGAQATSAPVASGGGGHCLLGNPIVRGLGGATIGGWIGFVAAKIRLSDWSDGPRSAADRTRNGMTIGGAALGAIVGILLPRSTCQSRRADAPAVPRSVRLPITAAEIQRIGASGSVYDVVYSLRRSWLNVRGVEDLSEAPRVVDAPPFVGADVRRVQTDAGTQIILAGEPNLAVYVDDTRIGTVSQLREMPTAGVLMIRYYDPTQASLRWGPGQSHGAIQVVTKLEPGAS